MYIFGGKDDENEKLKDFWRFDLNGNTWFKLPQPEASVAPRSGHSCSVFNNFLVIFGGIQEITKELDDLVVFDINKNQWLTIFMPFKETHDDMTSKYAGGNSASKAG